MSISSILALWLIADCFTLLLFRHECAKIVKENPDRRDFVDAATTLFSSPLHMTIALIIGLVAWPMVLSRLLLDIIRGR